MTRQWPALVVAFPAPGLRERAEVALQDLVSAELDGRDLVAIDEQAGDRWCVFFHDEPGRDAARSALADAFGGAGLRVTPIEVPDGDWARRTQAALGAVRVGAIVVAPPWDAAAQTADPDTVTIVIEPAMGFGSGHHATTRLCLAALQRLDLRGRRVLDIGTGSGVLALAAARLGAAAVLGIDVDPDALDNARQNAVLNASPAAVAFRQHDFRHAGLETAEIVIANLTGGMLVGGAASILACVAPAGHLILSGITAEEAEAVRSAFGQAARLEWSAAEDGWCVFVWSRGQIQK